jgi:uncharacterized protein
MPSWLILVAYLLPAALAGAAHLVVCSWGCRVFPLGIGQRRAAAVVMALLYSLPLARALAPLGEGFRHAAKLGSLWHLTIATSAVLIVGLRAALRLSARTARSAAPGAGAPPPALEPPGPAQPVALPAAQAAPPPAAQPAPPAAPRPTASAREAVEDPGRRMVLERIGGASALLASAGVFGWGSLIARLDWHVDEVAVRIPRLPRGLDGFTIVQISDLHVGPFLGERELAVGLAMVSALRADLIAVTGDVLDQEQRYIPVAARALGRLRARHGVVCVPGNHDHYAGLFPVVEGLTAAGVEVLLNRGKLIAPGDAGGLCILGVDDLSGRRNRTGPGPDLIAARRGLPPEGATILLAHQPAFFAEARAAGVDLQLSGHTHGGQINPGFVAARPLTGEFVAGLYERGASQLYVNRGFGTAGPPCRILAPPEITRIVLVAG